MISIDMICLGTGSVLAYAVDAIFAHVSNGWRYMVGLGAVPSILLGVFLFWCPESPRQLLYHNKREQSYRVVRQIYANASEQQIAEKVASIEYGVSQAKALEEEASVAKALRDLFCIRANLRALIAACGLMFFQQVSQACTLIFECPSDTKPVLRIQHLDVLLEHALRHCWIP